MVWQQCDGASHICTVNGTLYRLIESQEHIATLGYVDTLEEQAVLEALLEDTKPSYPSLSLENVATASGPSEQFAAYDYLLKTPFRYPPLKWGSRFGRMHEPSLFFGGLSVATTLAESAFYRFVFWRSMDGDAPKQTLHTEHTLFSVGYQSASGIRLQEQPFCHYQDDIAHPSHYDLSQKLGSDMRAANVDAFEYVSARDQLGGLCGALYTPLAFKQKKPLKKDQWFCELSATQVAFKGVMAKDVTRFDLSNFLIDGVFPLPA